MKDLSLLYGTIYLNVSSTIPHIRFDNRNVKQTTISTGDCVAYQFSLPKDNIIYLIIPTHMVIYEELSIRNYPNMVLNWHQDAEVDVVPDKIIASHLLGDEEMRHL